jgi:hypothetical protein
MLILKGMPRSGIPFFVYEEELIVRYKKARARAIPFPWEGVGRGLYALHISWQGVETPPCHNTIPPHFYRLMFSDSVTSTSNGSCVMKSLTSY